MQELGIINFVPITIITIIVDDEYFISYNFGPRGTVLCHLSGT